jgi:site-specific DNA-methyltransferase (adenine-specific)
VGAEGIVTLLYNSALCEVHHAYAEDVLPSLPTESFDLIVTDPPYGQEWQSNRRAEAMTLLANDTPADRDGIALMLAECVRLVGQNRHLYVFGPDDVLDGLKVSAPAALIWDKATIGSGDMTAPWGPAHEPITFAVSKHRHGGKAGCETLPARMRKGSVLRFARPTGRKVRHPSEKPVPLLRELIESSSRQGDRVLDPFAGIGSTGVAAILCGRRAVLVECDRGFADDAVVRVRAAEALVAQAADL